MHQPVYRLILLMLIVLFWFCPSVSLGQTPKPDSAAVLQELLAMPAPTPRGSAVQAAVNEEFKPRPPEFFLRGNPPPDDAPIADLLAYWGRWAYLGHRPKASQTVMQRIRDHCLDNPDALFRFMYFLPPTDTLVAKAVELYDKTEPDNEPRRE